MAKKEFDEAWPKVEMALYYAQELNWRVFPLRRNSKKPAIDGWPNKATTDTKQIKAWWAKDPDYNIGILTGNGLGCIDMDTKNQNENGPETLHDWETKNGALPDTLRVRTPTGSIHLYFHTKKDYGSVNHEHDGDTFFEDIDVHNNANHYMVGPGTTIDGKAYTFEAGYFPDEINLAEENETLTKFMNDAFSKPQAKAAETSTKSDSNSSERHEKITVPNEIKAGERHNQIVSLALSLRAQNVPEAAILSTISIVNDERCEEPKWKEKDLEKLVEWVMTKDTSQAQTEAQKAKHDEEQAESTATVASALVSLDNVEPEEAEWLVTDKIPRGQITTLVGSGGAGKTFVWVDLAAAISAGKTCLLDPEIPFDEDDNPTARKPAKVMFFSSEDSVKSILVQRLTACGANMNNILTIPLEDERFQKIRFDSDELKGLLAEYRPELCIFDPIQGFLPKHLKMSERNEMREALTSLIGYGEKFGTTFVIVVHCNKRAGAYGRDRMADSSDLWDISRSVLILGDTEDENGKKYRYISHEKSNYGPRARTILFNIADGRVKFEGTCDKDDRDFVMAKVYAQRSKPAREDATATISNMLLGGPMEVSELDSIILTGGLASKSTLKRAKTDLKNKGEIKFTTCGFGKAKKTYISFPNVTKEEIQEKYDEDVKNDHKNDDSGSAT